MAKRLTEKQISELKSALGSIHIPRKITESLLDDDNINRTYAAYQTSTLFLSRDHWVIDFAVGRAEPLEQASNETQAQLLGSKHAEHWKASDSKHIDKAIEEGGTITNTTERRVKRVSLDIEADDLYILKALADNKNVSIGTLIRQAIKQYIKP